MKTILSLFSLTVVLSSLVGCNPPSDSQGDAAVIHFNCGEGDANPGIIHGKSLSQNAELAKGIVLVAQYTDSNHQEGSLCTGSLIDSEHVITASHCVDENRPYEDVVILFSADPLCEKKANTLDKRASTGYVMHREYSKTALTSDIAMIRFKGGLPNERKPVVLAQKEITLKAGERILVAGYGKTEGYDLKESSEKKLRYGWVIPLVDQEKISRLSKATGTEDQYTNSPKSKKIFFDQDNKNGVCAGDSGGPAFHYEDGKWIQIGIASFVGNPERTSGQDACHFISAHTKVSQFVDWIELAKQNLAKMSEKSEK